MQGHFVIEFQHTGKSLIYTLQNLYLRPGWNLQVDGEVFTQRCHHGKDSVSDESAVARTTVSTGLSWTTCLHCVVGHDSEFPESLSSIRLTKCK